MDLLKLIKRHLANDYIYLFCNGKVINLWDMREYKSDLNKFYELIKNHDLVILQMQLTEKNRVKFEKIYKFKISDEIEEIKKIIENFKLILNGEKKINISRRNEKVNFLKLFGNYKVSNYVLECMVDFGKSKKVKFKKEELEKERFEKLWEDKNFQLLCLFYVELTEKELEEIWNGLSDEQKQDKKILEAFLNQKNCPDQIFTVCKLGLGCV